VGSFTDGEGVDNGRDQCRRPNFNGGDGELDWGTRETTRRVVELGMGERGAEGGPEGTYIVSVWERRRLPMAWPSMAAA
jgi:hypothetical protein